ncbi:MAG: sulfotransferase [Gammaproteobacteria bacterium]|nr:sulfotransferase [Gammaproteobacteria bacterium]
MALQVVNAGFGRTGTKSIKMALEELGFGPCHHMEEVFNNPSQLSYWEKAADGEKMDWDEVFKSYQSAVDWPSAHFWKELADFYPESKVLLSVRPAEQWWASYSETIKKLLEMRDEIPEDYPRTVSYMADKIVTELTFENATDDKEFVLSKFQQRIDDVKEAIPTDRLLIFQVTEGWAPLCGFLNVPIPEGDFPRSNAKVDFWDQFGPGV